SSLSDQQFRTQMCEAVKQFSDDHQLDGDLWSRFSQNIYYVPGDMADIQSYYSLAAKLEDIKQRKVLFYLSIQPSFYGPVADQIGKAGLAEQSSDGWRRIVIEKPFGHDLQSAQALNHRLQAVFPEEAIYRIDHYLGKETVQNILAFRFGNGIFEPLWN